MEKSKIKKAIEQSIKHWEKDILKPLLEGKEIYEGHRCRILLWKHSYKEVKCYTTSCPLCKFLENDCDCCPLTKYSYSKYSYCCHNMKSPWRNFRYNPNITNARKMIKVLKSVSEHYS